MEGQTIQWPKENKTKGEINIYNMIHRKLKIEQQEHQWKPGVNSGEP
jgi:hypothetical protein